MRILVVDDDRAVRESLRRSLTFNGYSVETAGDGIEALEKILADEEGHVDYLQTQLELMNTLGDQLYLAQCVARPPK